MSERLDEIQKTLWVEYSKSQHPTFGAVRFNARQSTYEFAYDCVPLAGQPLTNVTLEGYLLMPTLQVMWMPAEMMPVTSDEFEVMRAMVRETEIRLHGRSVVKPRPIS